jgi:PEGA domain-containing protein
MHGKDITFPKGTDVLTFVNGDMKLDPVKFQQAEATSTQPSVTAATSNLTISSTPVGADIYVDQNFVGNAPSTVNAPSDKRSVTVRKPGFQDWVHEMNFFGGSINLIAELVPGSTVPAAEPQGQAQSVQLQNADVTATSEVSVAEAARRNKAAKEAEKPKDNPQPQQ